MKYYLFLLFFIFSNVVSLAQNTPITIGGMDFGYESPREYELGPIRVLGADNYDHQAIKLIAGLRQGQRIMVPGQPVTNAIKNLWAEGIFSNVSIYAEKEIAGVLYLVIELAPRPKLSKYKFKGISRREADKLREEIALYAGKTITENLVFQTTNKIKGYFREKGYYDTKVKINREKDTLINDSELFLIDITKGPRIGIKKIEIIGNNTVPSWKLKAAMKDTKAKLFYRFWKRSKLTESAYERDKLAMMQKFNKAGLRDAMIIEDTIIKLDDNNLMIKINIQEGEKYYFGEFDWIGNTKYRSSFLDSLIGIKKGDVYNNALLEQRLNGSPDERDVRSIYMNRGHLFFNLIAVETNVTNNQINHQIRILEGKEARIGDISIKGNTKTNDKVILREIRTKPGDIFNKSDIMRTQRELAQLGFFNEQAFQVNPIPNPANGTVDIEYVLEEKSSDQIELSGGYGGAGLTTRGGIIGTLGLTFNNFSTRNFFKKEAWSPLPGGDGQRLSIRAQTSGRFYQGYNFSFTEPWLGGKKPNSLSFWVNHTALSSSGTLRTDPNYTGVGITGVGLGLGRRKKWPDDYFSAYYELGYQFYDVVNDFRFPLIEKGKANDISLRYTLQRTSVSSPIYPQSGSNFLFTTKATLPYSLFTEVDYAGATTAERIRFLEYYKFKLTGEWFLPVSPDKKLVVMSRFGYGFMGAYNKEKGVTPFDRFVMGGSGLTGVGQIGGREIIALRGYEDQTVSSDGGDPLIAKYTLELRYPISLNPSATFYALTFLEAGNTYPSFQKFNPFNVKRAAGIGIRVFLPMFGMLGLDYGLGFDELDNWSNGFGKASDQSIKQKGFYPKLSFTIGMNLGEL